MTGGDGLATDRITCGMSVDWNSIGCVLFRVRPQSHARLLVIHPTIRSGDCVPAELSDVLLAAVDDEWKWRWIPASVQAAQIFKLQFRRLVDATGID